VVWILVPLALVLLWAYSDSGWFGVKNVLGCLGMLVLVGIALALCGIFLLFLKGL
jgi:hypothetical protein